MHRPCDNCYEMFDFETGLTIDDDFAWCEKCYEAHQNEQVKDKSMKIKLDKPHITMLIPNLVMGCSVFKYEESRCTVFCDTVSRRIEGIIHGFVECDIEGEPIHLNKTEQLVLLDTLAAALEGLVTHGIKGCLKLMDEYYNTGLKNNVKMSERKAIQICHAFLTKFESEVERDVLFEYLESIKKASQALLNIEAEEYEALSGDE